MNTDKEFVPHEQALALKELGFDEPCFGRYNPDNDLIVSHTETYNTDFRKTLFTQAPTFSQAFKWFREKYDLKEKYGVFPHHTIMLNYVIEGGKEEEAELECLIKLIEITKNK